jgi:hypothetical protein
MYPAAKKMSNKGAYGLTRLGDWVDWVDFEI